MASKPRRPLDAALSSLASVIVPLAAAAAMYALLFLLGSEESIRANALRTPLMALAMFLAAFLVIRVQVRGALSPPELQDMLLMALLSCVAVMTAVYLYAFAADVENGFNPALVCLPAMGSGVAMGYRGKK